MAKRLFYLWYIPAVAGFGVGYFLLYLEDVNEQTGFYQGATWRMTALSAVGLALMAALYGWSVWAAGRKWQANATGNPAAWAASSILCGGLVLADALADGWQSLQPVLFARTAEYQKLALPAAWFLVSVAAAGSFFVFGVRLFCKNLTSYRHSAGLLILVIWQAARLVMGFSQEPMAFRMPQQLLKILLMAAQCLFLQAGSHLICNVIGKADYRRALFFGHLSVALGLIWGVCPLLAGHWAFFSLPQALDDGVEWALTLLIGCFVSFLMPKTSALPDPDSGLVERQEQE